MEARLERRWWSQIGLKGVDSSSISSGRERVFVVHEIEALVADQPIAAMEIGRQLHELEETMHYDEI